MAGEGVQVSLVPKPPPVPGFGGAAAGPPPPPASPPEWGTHGATQQEGPGRPLIQNAFGFLRNSAHPVTCMFHFNFKVGCVLTYVNGRYFFGSYTGTFIFVTLFAAFDFWTVKNVTGRILVGLRWWNHVHDDGSSEWVFESNPDESSVNDSDRQVFWTLVYAWPALWALVLLTNVMSFATSWVVLNTMVLVFAASNLIGYWKCSKDAKRRAREWVEARGVHAVVSGLGW
eukprot:gnl/TRDRNA2_/TRDRNA2_195134_c0_seq1.p1 gnl/TRDRNA2_/TRDRNA2_195134_c0~~gnl/TRDRNA2_/TRDRNA2_195134_c0_seq1.p1  ORF type:complete len:229 (+),score=36.95 gnl/TRDRNA2_/TRDRNA2_195134_c0_seq1:50-736(+)